MTSTQPQRKPSGIHQGKAERDMVWIPGGTFRMGSDRHYPEEAPAHEVTVDGFWIDSNQVTNRQFAEFVAATGHVTVAEEVPNAEDYPGALPEMLVAGSIVFTPPPGPVGLQNHYQWWAWCPGADWRHPEGPASSIEGKDEHPVLHVAFADISAYCEWAGKEIPSEAEWEFACRGGADGLDYAWGNELAPGGLMLANYWQGEFPHENLLLDGYPRSAPVGQFPANGYGLYDMIGNAWEWTTDWFAERHITANSCCGPAINPRGGKREASINPAEPGAIPRKVLKGGSYACAENYCQRYRPAARQHHPVDTGTNHVGFRCIVREDNN